MITTAYTAVLQHAVELTGGTYPPTTERATVFGTFILHNLRKAWETYPWPELVRYQQEFFAPDYDSSSTYATGDVVYLPEEETYYVALRAVPVDADPTDEAYWAEATASPSADPYDDEALYEVGDQVEFNGTIYQKFLSSVAGIAPTDTTYWGPVPAFHRFVSFTLNADGTNREDDSGGIVRDGLVIGEVFGAWEEDPRTTLNPTEVSREFYNDGTSAGMRVAAEIPWTWIKYRLAPPEDLASDDVLPARLSTICALKSAASMLRSDGKSDPATELEALAADAMATELDKVAVQEGQTQTVSVLTR